MADVIAGRFELLDVLARGGTGSVWRARDLRTGAVCAAKVLRQRDSVDLLRFVREKDVTLAHPHVLTPTGWAAEDRHVVIAMPLVAGPTLEALLSRVGPLSTPSVALMLDQLLQALGHVHAHGWVHRDVKPSNLLWEASGAGRPRLRLADFGIAVRAEDVRFTHAGMVNGTPGYVAPEVFTGAEPAPVQDLYAAGMCALLALRPDHVPQDGAIPAPRLDAMLDGVDDQVAVVVRRLLAENPDGRFADATEARAALPRPRRRARLVAADGSEVTIPDLLGGFASDDGGVGALRGRTGIAREGIEDSGEHSETDAEQRLSPAGMALLGVGGIAAVAVGAGSSAGLLTLLG
ncbi:MAG: serine/threonine-protein kinase [Brachybacterium sp.]|nr:serine/threonine-protein kinase [Brachybacterium sp.]